MNAPAHPAAIAPPLPADLLAALHTGFGARCSTAPAVCEQHGRDESVFDVPPPQAAMMLASVAALVPIATRRRNWRRSRPRRCQSSNNAPNCSTRPMVPPAPCR